MNFSAPTPDRLKVSVSPELGSLTSIVLPTAVPAGEFSGTDRVTWNIGSTLVMRATVIEPVAVLLSGFGSGTGTSWPPLVVVTFSVAEIVAFAVNVCPWVFASTVAVMSMVFDAPDARLPASQIQTPS